MDSKEWITRNPKINVNPHKNLENIEDCFLCNPNQTSAFEQDPSEPEENQPIPHLPEAGSDINPDVKIDQPQEVTNEETLPMGNFFKGCMIL